MKGYLSRIQYSLLAPLETYPILARANVADTSGARGHRSESSQRRAAIFPINKLPNELLIHVFVQCLEPDAFYPHHPKSPQMHVFSEPDVFYPHHPKSPQVILSQVCQLWRDLALRTPGLWRSLELPPFRYSGATTVLNGWLDRSRSEPFSLSLLTLISTLDKEDGQNEWAEALDSCLPRLRRLFLPLSDALSSQGPCPVFYQTRECPLLEELRVAADATFRKYQKEPKIFQGFSFPALRKVLVATGHVPLCHFGIPWRQLDSLTLSHLAVSACGQVLDVLRECGGLDELTVHFHAQKFTRTLQGLDNEAKSARLPHLRVLRLVANCPGLDRFLPFLDLPALCDLGIRTDDKLSMEAVVGLLRRSRAQVSELNIRVRSIFFENRGDLLELLRLTPDLVSLIIQEVDVSRRLPGICCGPAAAYSVCHSMDLFSRRSADGASLLPHLRNLYIVSGHVRCNYPRDIIQEALESRLSAAAQSDADKPLTSAKISFTSEGPQYLRNLSWVVANDEIIHLIDEPSKLVDVQEGGYYERGRDASQIHLPSLSRINAPSGPTLLESPRKCNLNRLTLCF
ncbi:hypothetical protein OE88DRAFT_1144011 [Heliocybe sulcata]|uniref:Uncharacterized protein n=1 Tax=Heliocybe sulcata TaxID=5364 RepID=A0A5C3NK97_9AGAM|nr:hypothetical protein OE88DRAFT_1144011 [Heliocybe sulcata]